MPVRHAAVNHEQIAGRRQGDAAKVERARVEEKGLAAAREGTGHLVHDADGRTDELVLGTTASPGELDIAEIQLEHRAERPADRDLEGGAGRQAAAEWDRRCNAQIEAGIAGAGEQDRRHAANEVHPVVTADLPAQRVLDDASPGKALTPDAHLSIAAGRDLDDGGLRDGAGEDEAVVVVSVIAHEVHAAGRLGADDRRAGEEFLKRRRGHEVGDSSRRTDRSTRHTAAVSR